MSAKRHNAPSVTRIPSAPKSQLSKDSVAFKDYDGSVSNWTFLSWKNRAENLASDEFFVRNEQGHLVVVRALLPFLPAGDWTASPFPDSTPIRIEISRLIPPPCRADTKRLDLHRKNPFPLPGRCLTFRAPPASLSNRRLHLTLVYGDNGAGKSGYGRVLKRACRARDQEEILTNQYAQPAGKPTARIEYAVAGTVQPDVAWQDGVAASPDLSNISVFDSKCASVHVGGPNELAYTPVPLQLLQALADIVRDFAGRLKAKKSALEGQLPSFRNKPQSRDGTAVHQIIFDLSATTQAIAITSLVQMSDHETQRLEQLKRDLLSKPVKVIRKLKALKQCVEELAKAVAASESVLLPGKADELRQLLVKAKDKSTAAKWAATEAFNREPLPQAGSEVWKTLWEAARAFSTQEAYQNHPFPPHRRRCGLRDLPTAAFARRGDSSDRI